MERRGEVRSAKRVWWMRRSVALLASVLLGATVLLPVTRADQLSDAQAQLAEAKAKAAEIQSNLSVLKNKASDIRGQLDSINQEINTINAQMGQLQKDIAAKDQQISARESDIQKTEAQIKTQNDLLRQRVRVMYVDGTVSYLDVILSSTSFSDFLDRLKVLSLIAEQDHKLLLAAQHDRQVLQAEVDSLNQTRQARSRSLSLLADAKSAEQQTQAAREVLLAQVNQNISAQQKNLDDEQAAMDSLASQIQQLEAAAQQQLSQFHGTGNWVWPVPSSHVISSGYGWRTLFGQPDFHGGVDIAAPIGAPIVAAQSGVVLFAGPAEGYGHWIVIAVPGNLMTIYGHMYANEIYVHPGEVVQAGQQIAAVGSDGEATGPHLHFGVATGITNGRMDVIDPTPYLP